MDECLKSILVYVNKDGVVFPLIMLTSLINEFKGVILFGENFISRNKSLMKFISSRTNSHFHVTFFKFMFRCELNDT